MNGHKVEKYLSTAQNSCDNFHQNSQNHADHPIQNHQFSDGC